MSHKLEKEREQAEQARKQDANGYMLTRRAMLKTTGVATGMALGGGSLIHPDSPLAAVEEGEALLVSGTTLAVGIVAGATFVAIAESRGWSDFDDGTEDATADQVHRNIYQNMIGHAEKKKELDTLLSLSANEAKHRIWGDALYQMATELKNQPEKSVAQIKADGRQYILDEYAKLQIQAISEVNEEMRGLVNAFQRAAQYEHIDSFQDVLSLQGRYERSTDTFDLDVRFPMSSDSTGAEVLANGSRYDALDPFGSETVTQDDLVKKDLSLVNGETEALIQGWSDKLDFYNFVTDSNGDDEWRTPEGNTITVPDWGPVRSLDSFVIHDPSDTTDLHLLPFGSFLSQMDAIENEANSMAGSVGDFIDNLLKNYTRENIPIQGIVPATTLWEEFGYEEGSAPFNAMAASQLGDTTNLQTPMTIRVYDSANYDPQADGNNPDEDGKVYNGYLSNFNTQLTKGEYYDPSAITEEGKTLQMITNTGWHDITGKFRVERITLYQDGEQQEVNNVDQAKDYRFNPDSADQWQTEYENVENAREAATQNPGFTLSGGGFAGLIGQIGWQVYAIGGAALASFLAFLKILE